MATQPQREKRMAIGNNKNIAMLLRQIGALLDEQSVQFKPAAYRKAAQTVEELLHDVSTFKTEKELMELPGIGPAIAGKIFEYLQTGRIKTLDELLAAQGGISPDLLMVEDLGFKRARQLQVALGIQTVADLIRAAEEGKLRHLPRFSELMEKKILENAKHVTERSRRFSRKDVEEDVETLLSTVRKVPGVEKAEVAGSFRRQKDTVGDIDILAVVKDREKVSDAIAHLPIVRHVVAHGEKKLSFDLTSGLRVDIRFVDEDQWGAALLYFTGDKEHNIALRKRAIAKGWKLNEYGLFEGEKAIASRKEENIYAVLGLSFMEPTRRTGELR
ncbi:MAG: type-X family DNA polymerase [Candidatus Peribacteraceae bacterium]|nr:type-X family DNA polymerase [Candidatus Peribacteraceae bacterium]